MTIELSQHHEKSIVLSMSRWWLIDFDVDSDVINIDFKKEAIYICVSYIAIWKGKETCRGICGYKASRAIDLY